MPDIFPYQPPSIVVAASTSSVKSQEISAPPLKNNKKPVDKFSDYVENDSQAQEPNPDKAQASSKPLQNKKDKGGAASDNFENKELRSSQKSTEILSKNNLQAIPPYQENHATAEQEIENILLNGEGDFIENVKLLEENPHWQSLSFDEQSSIIEDIIDKYPELSSDIHSFIESLDQDDLQVNLDNNNDIVTLFSLFITDLETEKSVNIPQDTAKNLDFLSRNETSLPLEEAYFPGDKPLNIEKMPKDMEDHNPDLPKSTEPLPEGIPIIGENISQRNHPEPLNPSVDILKDFQEPSLSGAKNIVSENNIPEPLKGPNLEQAQQLASVLGEENVILPEDVFQNNNKETISPPIELLENLEGSSLKALKNFSDENNVTPSSGGVNTEELTQMEDLLAEERLRFSEEMSVNNKKEALNSPMALLKNLNDSSLKELKKFSDENNMSPSSLINNISDYKEIANKVNLETKIASIPLKDNISLMVTKAVDNPQKIGINLEPAGMGDAELMIENTKDGIVAVVRSDRADTLDMIRKETASLEKHLREAGLDLAGGNLQFEQKDKSFDGHNYSQAQEVFAKSEREEQPSLEKSPQYNLQSKNIIDDNGNLDIRL